jgi:small multidrug resistance pump
MKPTPLSHYRPWFYAAALYNLFWGLLNIFFPRLFFDLVGMTLPEPIAIWQVVGMFVLVFAPGYWWAARFPEKYPHMIVIGLLGKIFGPVGFVWAVMQGNLPLVFGFTLLTNDLIWWPAFFLYLREAAGMKGGWRVLLSGA